MAVRIGTTAITSVGKIKLGSSNITKVYQGVNQIWPTTVITSYSYTVKLGTTLTNVCTASPTTVYSASSTWAFGTTLFTDALLTNRLLGFNYAVLSGSNDIWAILEDESSTYLNGDTGNNCATAPTAYGYTVKLGNDSGNVCTSITTFVYSDSATFGTGITLYDSASLTTIITSFTFVVESNNIYNLNSITGVVGTFAGTC